MEPKALVLMGLNCAMMGGSCLMKLPQILKILKANSVHGLSEAWVINECIAGLCWCYYNFLMGHPFMTWGEALIVSVQNVVIVFLYWSLSPQLPKAVRFGGSAVFAIISVAVLMLGLPPTLVSALGMSPIILGNGAKVPQVLMNYNQQHTGALSVIPCFLGLAGTSVRVLTSILQTPDDLLSILNPLTAACLWGVLFLQFVYYKSNTDKLDQKAGTKKAE